MNGNKSDQPRAWWCAGAFSVVALLLLVGCSQESKIEGHMKKAEAFFSEGEYEKAQIEYINVARLSPTNIHAYSQIGHISYENGLPLKAGAYYSRAIEMGETDPLVKARWAILSSTRDRAAGADLAREVLEMDPTQEEAVLLLADLMDSEDRMSAFEATLNELEQANGERPVYDTARAVLQMKRGQPDAALEILNEVAGSDPAFTPAHALLATIYLSRTNLVAGEAELKLAAENAPIRSRQQMRYVDFLLERDRAAGLARIDEILEQAPDYVPARMRRAQIAFEEEDFSAVSTETYAILSRDRGNIDARQLRAQMFLVQGEYEKAREVTSDLVNDFPQAPQLWYQAALTSIAARDRDRAVMEIERAYELSSDLPQIVLLRARLLIVEERVEEAITTLQNFLQSAPGYQEAYLQLAAAHLRLEQFEQAKTVYAEFERRFPNDPRGPHLRGTVLLQQNENADARAAFERSRERLATYFPPVESLVALDVAEEDYAAALQHVMSYLETSPQSAPAHVTLGRLYLAQEDWPKAEAAFDEAIRLKPDDAQSYLALVQIYENTGRTEESAGKLRQLLAERPGDIRASMLLAIMASQEGEHRLAADYYEGLIEAHPTFTAALNNLAYIYSEEIVELNRAYELAERARRSQRSDLETDMGAKITDTLGWIIYLQGDYRRALSHLTESASELPDIPEAQYHLGMTHYRLGNVSRAAEILKAAIDMAGDDEADWLVDAREAYDTANLDMSGDPEQALTQLRAMNAERPNDVVIVLRMAAVQESLGDTEAALANYRKVTSMLPDSVEALSGQARILIARGDADAALNLVRRARAVGGNDPAIAAELGRVALRAGDYPYSFAVLSDAVNTRDVASQTWLDYAEAATAVGRLNLARQAAEAGGDSTLVQRLDHASRMNVDPTATAGEDLLGRFIGGRLQAANGESAAAIAVYEGLLTEYPEFAPAMKQLAIETLKDPSNVATAERWAREARATMPDDVELTRVLGEAAFLKGDYRYAAEALGTAARTFGDDPALLLRLARSHAELQQVADARASLEKARSLPLSDEQKQQADAIVDML